MIPEQLADAVDAVRAAGGVRVSVRTFLSWFGVSRRGGLNVSRIEAALEEAGLRTLPDFSDVWIDDVIELVAREGLAASQAPQEGPTVTSEVSLPEVIGESAGVTALPGAVGLPVSADAIPPTKPGPAPKSAAPVQRIGGLAAAHRLPASVVEHDGLQVVLSKLRLAEHGVLLVHTARDGRAFGVITWRELALALSAVPPPATAGQLIRAHPERTRVPECPSDDDVFAVAAGVVERGFVFVRGTQKKLSGPVSLADLSSMFGARLEPFVLAGEVETSLRELLRPHDAQEHQLPPTLGEIQRQLEDPTRWEAIGLRFDRETFLRELNAVRELRNDLMHFNPDGVDEGEVAQLRTFIGVLRELLREREHRARGNPIGAA